MSSDVRSDMRSRDACSSGLGRPIPSLVASFLVAFLVVLSDMATDVRSADAEGAIAMGQTDTVGIDGLAFGAHYNDFDPNRIAGQASAECRISAASARAKRLHHHR